MNKQRALAAAMGSTLLIAPTAVSRAQGETDSAKVVRHSAAEANLAKAAQNPVANMVSLPLQYNYFTGGGLDSSSEMLLNVQPVIPLPIGERWLIVSRTVVPFLTVPLRVQWPAPTGSATSRSRRISTQSKPGKITWAVGPIFSFPTATNIVARTGQWGLGPGAVVLGMPGQWVIGALVNNIWRIGGTAHGGVLNSFTVQPFINYNLPRAWAISTSPLITSNWSAPSDQRWTVPIGVGVSKVTHVVEQPLNLELQYYHNVNHPRTAGGEQVRLEVAALWPTAAAEAARKKEEEAKKAGAKK